MNDYADAARKAGLIDLATILYENEEIKLAGQRTLEKLKLPTLKYINVSLHEFIQEPNKHFDHLNSDLYHVTLLSNIEGKGRIRAFPFIRNRVLQFIEENISFDERDRVILVLKEFYPNLYGGNIIVGHEGKLFLELVEGDHIHVVLGDTNIHATGHRPSFFKRLKIFSDHKNLKLEKVLEKTVKYLLHPGYYEFVIAQDKKKNLMPIFIDYRDREIYKKGIAF